MKTPSLFTPRSVAALLAGCFFASGATAATLLTDSFSYPVGDLPGNAGWTAVNPAADEIQVAAGSLIAPTGLQPSVGNKVTFDGAGTDAYVAFESQNSGTVFYSFLLNVTANSTTTGQYLGGFTTSAAPTTTATSGFAYRRDTVDTTKFNLGIVGKATNATVNTAFDSTQLSLNSVNLIVISHTFVAGSNNDITSLYINPTSFGGSAPTPTLTLVNSASDAASISAFYLFQAASATPFVQFDELRIGTTWADVTPLAVPEPGTWTLLIGGFGLAMFLAKARRRVAGDSTDR